MKNYIKLMRVHHYLKNILVFAPAFFAKQIFEFENILKLLYGFLIFSLVCSVVYIINDINDIDKDKIHPKKKYRPLASGIIGIKQATILAIVLIVIVVCCEVFLFNNIVGIIILGIYLFVNIIYSTKVKNIPLFDILILVLGYVLRIYYGATILNGYVSTWLFLSVLAVAFFLGFGKRRNELIKRGIEYREVLKYYSRDFLDKVMYMFLGITIVFYALWCENMSSIYGNRIIFTVILVIFIVLRYSLNIELDSDGDPIDVILEDKLLIILGIIYIMSLVICVYI